MVIKASLTTGEKTSDISAIRNLGRNLRKGYWDGILASVDRPSGWLTVAAKSQH